MISTPLNIAKWRPVPIHIYTVQRADGTLRRKVIPGGYTAPVRDRMQAKLAPGDRIVDRTWRPDWRFLDHPAGGDDYGETNPR